MSLIAATSPDDSLHEVCGNSLPRHVRPRGLLALRDHDAHARAPAQSERTRVAGGALEHHSDLSIKMEESSTLHADAPQDVTLPATVPQGPHRHDPHGSRGVRVHPDAGGRVGRGGTIDH